MHTPWRQWRGHAFVTLGWAPGEFWAATPHDLLAALDAQHDMTSGNSAHGLTRDVLHHLDTLRNQENRDEI